MSRFINTELKSDSDLYSEDDDDELINYFCGMVLTDERRLALFQPGPLSDPHHRESPTRREQGLSLHRTCV